MSIKITNTLFSYIQILRIQNYFMETNYLSKKFPKNNLSASHTSSPHNASTIQLNQVSQLNQTMTSKGVQFLTAKCLKHQSEILTNYCTNLECLIPLCPDCIEPHLDYHKQQKISPDIESIKQARVKGILKLDKLIEFILKQLESLEPPKSIDKILIDADHQLKTIKQFIMRTIEQYFLSLEENLKLKINDSAAVLNKINNSHMMMRKMLDELRNLTQILRLNDEATPGTIKKVIQINQKSLLNSFTSELEQYNRDCKKIQINVRFDEIKFRQNIDQNIKIQLIGNSESHSNKSMGLTIQDNLKYRKNACLHFFETGSSNLHMIDLSTLKQQMIDLKSDYEVPQFHNSILLTNGEIWISGGKFENDKKNKYVGKYIISRRTFEPRFTHVIERSSHSLCEYNGSVYILGGYGNDGQSDNSQQFRVQRVNMESGDVAVQSSCNFGGSNISIVRDGSIFKISVEGLQIYNTRKKQWQKIRLSNFYFYESCSGINVNDCQILIFGGYQVRDQNDPGRPVKSSYVIDILDLNNVHIKDKGKYDIPIEGGFRNNIPVIHNKHVYALQNIDTRDSQQVSNSCLDADRTLLRFDGRKWIVLNV